MPGRGQYLQGFGDKSVFLAAVSKEVLGVGPLFER